MWPGTPIWDTSCCFHPLTSVPCLRPGPRRPAVHRLSLQTRSGWLLQSQPDDRDRPAQISNSGRRLGVGPLGWGRLPVVQLCRHLPLPHRQHFLSRWHALRLQVSLRFNRNVAADAFRWSQLVLLPPPPLPLRLPPAACTFSSGATLLALNPNE